MLKPGMILCDRYEILEVVGAGGMSIVYKARCHRLNRNVAIKVLKPEFSNDKNFVTKFKVEAQASAGLTHPNIVNVYDVYDDDGIYFIVMELVEGITLKEYIEKNGRLTMDQAIDFSIQIASGIEAAHESHIIHRDIKPQNIIVAKNANCKVTDFGIAKAATSNTLTSGAMGSVHYISPEQARGGYSDERSDIYSLGITMYEMVTGRVPFEGDNNVSVALMHIQSEMISPRQYYPDIYTSFEKVIMKATQKKPERRYLTASALIADLRRVQNNPNIDIVVAPTAITNSPTQEWTKKDVKAIREGMGKDGDSQLNTFENGSPLQNEMGELKPIGGLSTMPINKKINDILNDGSDEDYDEEEPVAKKGGIKKIDDDYDEDDEEYEEGEEEYSSDMDPSLKKAIIIGASVSAVVVVIVVVFMVKMIFGSIGGGNDSKDPTTTENQLVEELPMIDVMGYAQDVAMKSLKDVGFNNIKIESVANSDVQAGYVFDQNYKKGKVLPADTQIVLTVSSGAEPIEVPNVVGNDADQAERVLVAAGFKVRRAYETSEDVPKDEVISMSPEANETAPAGSEITITVSNGKEEKPTTVPNLTGLTEDEAVESLENSKLKVGEITKEFSEDVKKGYVISSSPAKGEDVNEGDTVDIVISKGPDKESIAYVATIDASLTCIDESIDSKKISIQIWFDGDIVDQKDARAVFDDTITITAQKGGLSSDAGSEAIVVIDSKGGANITDKFNLSTKIKFEKVTIDPENPSYDDGVTDFYQPATHATTEATEEEPEEPQDEPSEPAPEE